MSYLGTMRRLAWHIATVLGLGLLLGGAVRRQQTRRPSTTTWRCSSSARASCPRPSARPRRPSRCDRTTARPTSPWATCGGSRATCAKAAAALEKAVELQPKDAAARANLGAVYLRQKRLDDGIAQLEAALALKPDDYETLVSLGYAYRQKGDLPKAVTHLQKATTLKPDRRRRLEQPGRGQGPHRRQGGRHRRLQEGPGDRARPTPTTTSAWPPSTAASARPRRPSPRTRRPWSTTPSWPAPTTTSASCTRRRSATRRPWPPSATTSNTAAAPTPRPARTPRSGSSPWRARRAARSSGQ